MTFLKSDEERARKEFDCYTCCDFYKNKYLKENEYGKAAAYMNNAQRSLQELERMKCEKEVHDQAWLLLKQIEGQQQVDRTIEEMRSRL